jgi:opacity protein-like surface antigen
MENGARMMGRGVRPALAVAASLLLAVPGLAAAEPYLAGFVGAAITENNGLDTTQTNNPVSVNGVSFLDGTLKNIEFDTSVVFGGKVGYYFDHPALGGNFGLELEVYHFEPNVASQTVVFSGTARTIFGTTLPPEFRTTIQKADIDVTAVGLNLLYRLELGQSDNFPHGRFQPYAGVGLGLFVATLSTTTTPFDTNKSIEDTDTQPGGQILLGARFFLSPNIAIFAEYKFVQTAEFSFRFQETATALGLPATETARDQADLTQHQFLAGVGFHW